VLGFDQMDTEGEMLELLPNIMGNPESGVPWERWTLGVPDPGSGKPWERRTLGVVDPGSGISWKWRTLGVASRHRLDNSSDTLNCQIHI